ncbi:rhodanese-like domain-containing protein [Flavobacterium algicola]|uniref:rhodanese-like domain-containing protein n=1 Tax=Flavobacterium algicola TaxID=556529 RepID=UPI001EFD7E70|nr:rhodanese-like domain-containing protein [Flavobacterium algicola]MCG9792249.1 rhodanese-like domain-containing protein [Flavobacterium algicola]
MRLLFYYILLSIGVTTMAQKKVGPILNLLNSESVPYITTEDLKKSKFVLLDSREPEEYKVSHIPNAVFVGYGDFKSETVTQLIKNRNTPIVVYCSIGVRSENIGEKLLKLGYTNVQNLYGGIFEYKNKGGIVVNKYNKKTDSVHTYNKKWGAYLNNGIKIYEN